MHFLFCGRGQAVAGDPKTLQGDIWGPRYATL